MIKEDEFLSKTDFKTFHPGFTDDFLVKQKWFKWLCHRYLSVAFSSHQLAVF